MRQLYLARTPFEAHFLKGLLESAGIEAEVRGELMFGVRGEIPMTTETLPSVWVDDRSDMAAAQEIVRRYESREGPSEAAGPSWRCGNCGENLEGQFSSCWRCGTARPEAGLPGG